MTVCKPIIRLGPERANRLRSQPFSLARLCIILEAMTNVPQRPPGMLVDLHVHTSIGSTDSGLTPPRLLEAAYEVGLDGVAITEHTTPWSSEQLEELRRMSEVDRPGGLFICGGREWPTEYGHIIALGLGSNASGIQTADELRRAVDAVGGFLIVAHPFRFFPGSSNYLFGARASTMTAEQLAEHPVFSLVDEIEVLNYACTDRENQVALEVARVMGKRGVGGSDAHTYSEVGRCVTVLERAVHSEAELIEELRAGRFGVARRKPNGDYVALD